MKGFSQKNQLRWSGKFFMPIEMSVVPHETVVDVIMGLVHDKAATLSWVSQNMQDVNGAKLTPAKLTAALGEDLIQKLEDQGKLVSDEFMKGVLDNVPQGAKETQFTETAHAVYQQIVSTLRMIPYGDREMVRAASSGDDQVIIAGIEKHGAEKLLTFAEIADCECCDFGMGGHVLLANYIRSYVDGTVRPGPQPTLVFPNAATMFTKAQKAVVDTDLHTLKHCAKVLKGDVPRLQELATNCALVGFDDGIRCIAILLKKSGASITQAAVTAALSTDNGTRPHTFAAQYAKALVDGADPCIPLGFISFTA